MTRFDITAPPFEPSVRVQRDRIRFAPRRPKVDPSETEPYYPRLN
jgi:hypothetical protein